MNLSLFQIFAFVLAGISVGGTFVPRFPSAVVAYAAMVCMYFAGVPYFDSGILIFWAVATIIVLGLMFLQPKALTGAWQGHGYVAGGTILGVVLGYLVAPAASAIILGGAVGAFLGTLAFMRTPRGPRFPIASSEFLQYLCAKGLPCVVASSMAALTIASAL